MSLKLNGISNDKLFVIFIGILKDNIQHEAHLLEPTSLENDFIVASNGEIKNAMMATRRTTSNTYWENNVPSFNLPQPTRLIAQEINERREKGILFDYDNMYSKGHNCGEKKWIYIDCEEEEEKEHEPSQDKEISKTTSE